MKLTKNVSILLLFNVVLCDSEYIKNITAIFQGGCAVIKKGLYQLGGKTNHEDNRPNEFVYSLDLGQPFEIFEGQAPWKIVGGGMGFQGAINPAVISESINSTRIFMLGGEGTLLEKSFFKIFDTETNSWYDNKDAGVNLQKAINASIYLVKDQKTNSTKKIQLNDLLKDSPSFLSLSVNNYEDSIVMYGGLKIPNDPIDNNDKFATFVFYYAIKNSTWELIQTKLPPSFGHNSHIFNDKLFFLGGLKKPKGENFRMNEIRTFNLKTFEESFITTTGEFPPPTLKFLSAKYKNYIFTATIKPPISSIYRLDLDTMIWDRIDVGLLNIMGEITCLNFYNHFLIVTSATRIINTYVIDTLSNTVVKKLMLDNGYLKGDNTLIIVLSLVGFAIIAGLFAIYWYKRRKRKELREPDFSFNFPELLRMELQWNDIISNIMVANIDPNSKQKYFTLDSSESLYNYEIDMDDTNLPKPKMDQAILLKPSTTYESRNTLNLRRGKENHTITSNDDTLFQRTTLLDGNDLYFQKK